MKTKGSTKQIDSDGLKFLQLCYVRYAKKPILFAEEVVGIKLTKQQKRAMNKLCNSKKRVAVKSGHGVGKSCMMAVIILWFLACKPMCRVIVTAPSSNQLYNTMMSEVRLWYNSCILKAFNIFRFTKDRIRINDDTYCNTWFLSAVSVANPENISGTHSRSILAIIDEGAGVDEEIFVRIEGVLTTPDTYVMTCGNPSFTSGYFYDIFHKPDYMKMYDLFTFSCIDSENVSKKWINDMKEKYGEDSNIYKVRVLGEFAPMNEDVIIRREDIISAIGREIPNQPTNVTYIGVDVSSGESNDYSCISVRQGLKEIYRYKTKERIRDLKNTIIIMATKYSYKSTRVVINIDTTGLGIQIGQDVSDHFFYSDFIDVNRINFSFKAQEKLEYGNSFTEMFFTLKEVISKVSLLKIEDSMLEEDLGSRRFGYDGSNRFLAEKKKEFIKRYRRSPDEGDAVLLSFYDVDGYNNLKSLYLK